MMIQGIWNHDIGESLDPYFMRFRVWSSTWSSSLLDPETTVSKLSDFSFKIAATVGMGRSTSWEASLSKPRLFEALGLQTALVTSFVSKITS